VTNQLSKFESNFGTKNIKQLPRADYKSDEISFAILNSGIVQTSGGNDLSTIHRLSSELVLLFDGIKNKMTINKVVKTKVAKTCKRPGPCKNGTYPKIIKGKECCFKTKPTKNEIIKQVKLMRNIGIQIPPEYAKYASVPLVNDKPKINMIKFIIEQPVFKKGKIVTYKKWNCELAKKSSVEEIAKSLKLTHKQKKNILCKNIELHLKKQKMESVVNV
jgi:hypothetical protein